MRCLRHSLLIPALLTGLGSTLAFEVPFPEYPPAGSALVVLDNFIGISFELSSFDTLCAFHHLSIEIVGDADTVS